MAERKTAVEVYRNGTRLVYHHHVPNLGDEGQGFAWTHPDSKRQRANCSMCAKGTLADVRGVPR